MVKIFFIIVVGIFYSVSLWADVIWEQDFDDYSDWTYTQPTGSNDYAAYQGEGSIPDNFHSIRVAGSFYSDIGNNTIYIDNKNYRGSSGKAITFYCESDTRGGGGAGWSSDGILGISISSGYSELYIQYYIKFQSGWEWNTSGENEQKNSIRVTHYHGGSPFSFFETGNQHPIADMHLTKYFDSVAANDGMAFVLRYDNNYYPYDATPVGVASEMKYVDDGNYGGTGTDLVVDGDWHRYDIRIKINTSAGTADGIMQWWLDGVLEGEKTNVAWIDQGGDTSHTWNYAMIGGNDYNHWASNASEEEQWYAIDDVVISTTSIPSDYVIGGVPPNVTGVIGSGAIRQ